MKTVENHKKWIEAAKFLGCHSIRVNTFGEGNKISEQDGIRKTLALLNKVKAQYIEENTPSKIKR